MAAGHGGLHGTSKTLDGDFDGQARQAFDNIAATLAQAGARLADVVTMTVFIIDARYGERFIEIRKEYFPDGNYPASALITVAGFARPTMMVIMAEKSSGAKSGPNSSVEKTVRRSRALSRISLRQTVEIAFIAAPSRRHRRTLARDRWSENPP